MNDLSKREYNFDLLRIVSMIMVAFLHAVGKGRVLAFVKLFSYISFNVYVFIDLAKSLGIEMLRDRLHCSFFQDTFDKLINYLNILFYKELLVKK